MKTRSLFLALLILISGISNAQVGKFIKNQASKAAAIVNREAEKEANRKADSIAQANAERAAKETSKNIDIRQAKFTFHFSTGSGTAASDPDYNGIDRMSTVVHLQKLTFY